jgi:hypothetical protein
MKRKVSDTQETGIIDKRNALRRRIERWQEIQLVYMPAVSEIRAHSTSTPSPSDRFSRPELIPLHLPSSLPVALRSTLTADVFKKESRLRVAQADDALAELKKLLRITMGLWDYKHTLGPSQGVSTRARTLITRFRDKVNRCADRYRATYSALKLLDPNGDWVFRLLELKAADVKPPQRDKHSEGITEGQQELSWIWLVQHGEAEPAMEASEEEIGDSKSILHFVMFRFAYQYVQGIRVEWAKARARALRWDEEVDLLNEEMRRVLCYLDWKSAWWMEFGTARHVTEEHLREGLTAYASKQAHILSDMASRFADLWYPELARSGIEPDWPPHYLTDRTVSLADDMLASPDGDDDLDIDIDADLFD